MGYHPKSDKLKYLIKLMHNQPPHKYHNQISIYYESHFDNPVKNTPKSIESRLKLFFPDMITFFKELHERFD